MSKYVPTIPSNFADITPIYKSLGSIPYLSVDLQTVCYLHHCVCRQYAIYIIRIVDSTPCQSVNCGQYVISIIRSVDSMLYISLDL